MAEYQLYCMGESGNCYKVALMLQLTGCDWEPVFVDFFDGETRSERYRREVNEMGEVPVLAHRGEKMTQSGVMLDYLVGETGQFGWRNDEERREILRWMLFDNHKFTSYYATLRYFVGLTRTGDPAVIEFLRGRVMSAFGIVDRHLRGPRVPARQAPDHRGLLARRLSLLPRGDRRGPRGIPAPRRLVATRIAALPGWKHPYDLMPRGLPGAGH